MSETERPDSPLAWRKSGHSISNGACAEVAAFPGTVMVRDSVSPSAAQLRFASSTWQQFIAGLKDA
jgi:predicted secreted Zn-dependent protease